MLLVVSPLVYNPGSSASTVPPGTAFAKYLANENEHKWTVAIRFIDSGERSTTQSAYGTVTCSTAHGSAAV